MKNQAVHKKIEEDIVSQIRLGKWPVNSQIPTQNELAQKFYKVSRLTVSKAISRLIDRGYLYSIRGKGVYVKNIRPKKIAFLFPGSLWAINYLEGILKKSADFSMNPLIYNTVPEEETALVSKILDSNINGVIYYPRFENIVNGVYYQTIMRLKEAGIPLVILERYWQDIESTYVMPDFFQVGYIAGSKLLENGHRKICYVGAKIEEKIDSSKGRFNGFMSAIKDFGLSLVVPTFELTEEIVPQILENFTGAFFYDDFSANIFLSIAEKNKIKATADFSVIGCGNLSSSVHPEYKRITSLEMITKQAGGIACEILYNKINGVKVESITKIPVKWVNGNSTLKNIKEEGIMKISNKAFSLRNQLDLVGGGIQ